MKQKVIVPTVALIFVFSSVRGYALESRNDWDKVMQKYLFDIPKYPKFQFVQLDIEKPSRNYTKVYTFGKKIYGKCCYRNVKIFDCDFVLVFCTGDYKLDYWNYSIDYEKIVDDGYCIFYNISLSHGEFVVQQVINASYLLDRENINFEISIFILVF